MKIYLLIFLLCAISNIKPQQDSIPLTNAAIKDTVFTGDSSMVDSSSIVKFKTDSLVVLASKCFSNNSFFIHNHDITFNDYRYAGDILNIFPFIFIQDLGFIGQPNENYLYGVPSSSISYLNDGIYFNNRFSFRTDLNQIQTESIDSIEIINLPRGFLFGSNFNIAAVNFIEKNIYSKQPFTRIKYYEGPFGEAFVDGIFNLNIYKRLNIYADVSNKKVDNRYVNSDLSLWRVGVKVKYLPSNSINLLGSYYHIKSLSGFNGGVNVDSISIFSADINSVLFDNVLAPVKFPTRFLKSTQHHFDLRSITDLKGWGQSDIQLYYKFTLDEDYEPLTGFENKFTNKNKVLGLNAVHTIRSDFWKLYLAGSYEKQILRDINVIPSSFNEDTLNVNSISFSAASSFFLFDSTIVPSIFSRITHQNTDAENGLTPNETLFGIGADIAFKINNEIDLYFGVSNFDQKFSGWNQILTAEVGVNVNYEIVNAKLKLFKIDNLYVHSIYAAINYSDYNNYNIFGSSLSANINLWHLTLETLTSIYKNSNGKEDANALLVPDITFRGGLYYKGFAFNANLELKAGFVFYYIGKQIITEQSFLNLIVEPSHRLDFTLAGQIQKTATVYFTWENLFDNNYFITPYYPMPDRSIRFGLSWELLN